VYDEAEQGPHACAPICLRGGPARRGFEAMHLRITNSCLFLAVALIGSAGDAHAVDCQSQKGDGYPWAWREIDGKRCWYRGRAGMDKKLLRWASTKAAPSAASKAAPSVTPKRASVAPNRASPVIADENDEHHPLLNSYWPPLPRADGFGDRFEATRGERP
jgi:hypothetical protein